MKNKKINQVLKSNKFVNHGGTDFAKIAFNVIAFDADIIKVIHDIKIHVGDITLESIC